MTLSSVIEVEVYDQNKCWLLLISCSEELWWSSNRTETAVPQFAEVI